MGSSEALLSGQRPPFRLLVRARLVGEGVLVHHIRHAVSDNFVVGTKRSVRYLETCHIPFRPSRYLHAAVSRGNCWQSDIGPAAWLLQYSQLLRHSFYHQGNAVST